MSSHRDEPIRVLLVGAGDFGRVHASQLRGVEPECRVVGVCDPHVPEGLEALGIEGWRDLDEALLHTRPDLVSVVTPTWTHANIVERLLAAGHRVLVEKPVALNPDEAASLIRTQSKLDGWVDVVSQRRFQEGAQRLRECIVSGELGTVSSASGSAAGWRDPDYYAPLWRGRRAHGGGNFLNQGMHVLDLMLWLFGTPLRSESFMRDNRHPGSDIDEVCVGIVEFEMGILVVVESSLVARPGEPFRLAVRGDAGTAVLTDAGLTITRADSADTEFVHSCDTAQALTNQYTAVATALRRGEGPTVGVEAASQTLNLAWRLSTPTSARAASWPAESSPVR